MRARGPSPGRVVIIGGGFGGLYAAKVLGEAGVPVTVVDRRNFHLFQPLLYQIATGGLSPGDVASPIRSVLRRHRSAQVLLGEAVDIDPAERAVLLADGGRLPYDFLVVATGSETSYFGHDAWQERAPALKTVEDALLIRQRVLDVFERAEREHDPELRRAPLIFVVVGGGPTGVELAGAIAELARSTLARDFRAFDPRRTRVLLLEGGDRILPTFPPELSHRAERSLARLGVEVRTGALVTAVGDASVRVRIGGREEPVPAASVLWAAGVAPSPFARCLVDRLGALRHRSGRIVVGADLSLPGHPEVFVIGDLAAAGPPERPLPGLAPVAMQQGRFVARRILGREPPHRPFRYRDKGQLAVIGRNAAVCDLGRRARFWGWPAWLLWVFVHIAYLIEYDHKILVLAQWAMSYVTRKRGARLITHSGAE